MEKEKLINEADILIKSNEKLLSTLRNKNENTVIKLSKGRTIEFLEQDLIVTALVLKVFIAQNDEFNKYLSRFINLGNVLSDLTGKSFTQVCKDIAKKLERGDR